MSAICRIRLGIAAAAFVLPLHAANWYVDNAASGANDGTSWANAWVDFSNILWASVSPGDTVFVSGGRTSKVYTNQLKIQQAGTPASPITIHVGQDAGHNGVIYLSSSVALTSISYSNVVIDGGRRPTFNTNGINPLTPWGITNNIGIVICPPNAPSVNGTRCGVYVRPGSGIKLRWLEIRCGADANAGNYGIVWDLAQSSDGERHRDNCEIGCCYIHHNTKDGIYDASASYRDGMGRLVIHHSIIMWNGDDGFEGSSGVDICHNRMGEVHPTYVDHTAHPDTIQAPGFNVRIYNNLLTTADNSATFCLPLADWGAFHGGNRYFYGNVVYQDNTNRASDLINIAPRNYNYGTNSHMEWTNIVIVNNTTANSHGAVPGIKWGGFTVDVAQWRTNSTYQTLSNSWVLNNVVWRVCQGLPRNAAISVIGPCDVDYNTVDTDGGLGSKVMAITTNVIHHGAGDNDFCVYNTPELYNDRRGKVSNITAGVTFVSETLGTFDFRLASTDTGARNRGLNLSTYLPAAVLADMPDYGKDLLGNTRGADGAWDRGALEYTPQRRSTR